MQTPPDEEAGGVLICILSTGMTDHSPALLVDGEFQGRLVLLHGCLEPPQGFEATEIFDLTGLGGRASGRRNERPSCSAVEAALYL
jgi:hypothetical protein